MHFTYESEPRSDLHQGDILQRTDALLNVLREVHPHYCTSATYNYFVVLTQSCDLVRRDGACKSRYIAIAAVRPFELVVQREIAKYQQSPTEKKIGFCRSKFRERVTQFVERVLNNNESRYFFLFQEPGSGLTVDHCAFLNLSIALKSDLHYEMLLAARILQLTESFQHKLGYLVGNLYSRIGTEDWVPNHSTAEQFAGLCKTSVERGAVWVDESLYRSVMKYLETLAEPTFQHLKEAVNSAKATRDTRRKLALEALMKVLDDHDIPAPKAETITLAFSNRPEFTTAIK